MDGDMFKDFLIGVVLFFLDDEFVFEKEFELWINIILFGQYDSYEGVIIDYCSLLSDVFVFKKYLIVLIVQWKKEVLSLYLLLFCVFGKLVFLQYWIRLVVWL